jgi:hypothetical protein
MLYPTKRKIKKWSSIMNTQNSLRPRTVKLISRLMRPLIDEGIILVSEDTNDAALRQYS